ncbi:MAG: V0D/AC39 family V-type ATPase subunit [Huintestinicola sp.]
MIGSKKDKVSSGLHATVAKIHAVYGKRLSQDDYSALMGCTSVTEAATYLKHNTHYAKILEGIDTNTIHRGMLEDILHRSVYENYFRIIGFEKISGSEFYNYLIIKTEIDEILICIQHLNAGSEDHINTLPIYMDRYTSFDLLELAKVRSFSELMYLLEKTPYYGLLKDMRPAAEEDGSDGSIDYPACELKLRSYYYNRVLDSLNAFDKDTRKRLTEYIGTQIDMINIINSYRMTKYFSADENVIKPRMIPIHKHYAERTLDELYKASDSDEFVKRFSQTGYGRSAAELGFDMSDPESALVRLRYKQTKRAFSRSVTAPECFFTFNMLMETEVKNIIRIIEGIRYSLPAKEISALLIS